MDAIVSRVRAELGRLSSDPANVRDYSRFYKDASEYNGLSTPLVREVSVRLFRELRGEDADAVLRLCDGLLSTKERETRLVAFDWAFRVRKHYEARHFKTFERWLRSYVTGWGSCDDLCTHALGYLLLEFPGLSPGVRSWARSRNRWMRRAAAVALIYPLRHGKQLDSALAVSDALLHDKEDLVQKGCGWMLKEADGRFHAELLGYLSRRKAGMPRVTLRYAVEKMPKTVRTRLLS